MKLRACIATHDRLGALNCSINEWGCHDPLMVTGRGLVEAYQCLFLLSSPEDDVLAYIHDDVRIDDPNWQERVLAEFEHPQVGVVGFGGAIRHGTADIYKTPYRLQQLARDGYLSNVDDAEAHGTRYEGSQDVAVLDGFCLCVRRELLVKAKGWPVDHLKFHCYDYWLACMAHRLGYSVRMVGVPCKHFGGRTSVSPAYQKWCEEQGTTDLKIHEDSHRWCYTEFKDVLPYWIA